jgi:hypothetical protein
MKPLTNRLSHIGLFVFFPLYFFWRKTRKTTVVVSALMIVVLSSCFLNFYRTNTKNSIDANTLKNLQTSSKYFIIHFTNNNKAFGLAGVSVNGDKLEGNLVELPEEHKKYLYPNPDKTNRVKSIDKTSALMEVHLYNTQPQAEAQTHISIPISAISRIDVYELDRSATSSNHILSWVGVAVGTVLVVGLIAFAIACNCPQVYVNNNGQYEFKSGVYSGAAYSTLERSDYLPLEGIKPVNEKYQFRIGNFETEEQFINQVRLLKADHPADVKVLADRNGRVLSYKNPAAPVSATCDEVNDVTNELKYTDAQYYSFDSKADENGFSFITASFEKPAEANKAKLLIHGGNSKWSGYIYNEFASLFGDGFEKWRNQQEKDATANPKKWQLDQALPMKVFVKTDHGWQYIDHFPLTGNTASRDMIMEINLADVKTDKVVIKIESTYRFWDLDMMAMDFSDDAVITATMLDPVAVIKNDSADQRDELLQQDKKYINLTGNEFVNIEFDAPKPVEENTTSWFLVSSGYYHSQPKSEGKADIPSLLKFKEKGEFDRFSRNKYAVIEETLAKAMIKQPGKK